MLSSRKLVANRQNALLSTGPRTPAGKAVSSSNALTHGVFAQLPVLSVLGETPDDWDAHRDAVVASLAPVGAVELNLAERAAYLLWRLARAAKFDTVAAAVALAPAAALEVQDHVAAGGATRPGDEVLSWYREAADGAVVAADKAAACRRAAAALRSGGGRPDDPVDVEAARAVVAACGTVCRFIDPDRAERVARRVAAGFGPAPFPAAYATWTAGRARAVAAAIAADAGQDEQSVTAAASAGLAAEADRLDGLADRYQREALAADGERTRRRAGAAFVRVANGPAELELATRYERHLGNALAQTLGILRAMPYARAETGPTGEASR